MRIENNEVIFEEKDEELKKTFLAWMEEQKVWIQEADEIERKKKVLLSRLKIVIAELQLFREKHKQEIWQPIDAALVADLGIPINDVPNMSFSHQTKKITVVKDKHECTGCGECDDTIDVQIGKIDKKLLDQVLLHLLSDKGKVRH